MSARPAARRRLTVLVGLLSFVMVAPWLAPRAPELQEDAAGARYLPPLTRAHALRTDPYHLRIVTRLRRTPDGWQSDGVALRAGTPFKLTAPTYVLEGEILSVTAPDGAR